VTGAPKDLVEVYQEAFSISFKDADYLANAKKRNITVVEPQIGERFGKTMKEQQALVGDLIQYFIKGGYIKK
jgi:hypothetical protein